MFTNSQDLAIQTANNEGASYILAQDPDADRFAAAERKCVYTSLCGHVFIPGLIA